jgi:hypothetical protein
MDLQYRAMRPRRSTPRPASLDIKKRAEPSNYGSDVFSISPERSQCSSKIPAMTVSLLVQKAPCGSFESTPRRLVLIHLQAPARSDRSTDPELVAPHTSLRPYKFSLDTQMHEAGARTRATMAERFLPSETSGPTTSPASQTTPGQALPLVCRCQPPPYLLRCRPSD